MNRPGGAVHIFDMPLDQLGQFGLTEPGKQRLLRRRQAGCSRVILIRAERC